MLHFLLNLFILQLRLGIKIEQDSCRTRVICWTMVLPLLGLQGKSRAGAVDRNCWRAILLRFILGRAQSPWISPGILGHIGMVSSITGCLTMGVLLSPVAVTPRARVI